MRWETNAAHKSMRFTMMYNISYKSRRFYWNLCVYTSGTVRSKVVVNVSSRITSESWACTRRNVISNYLSTGPVHNLFLFVSLDVLLYCNMYMHMYIRIHAYTENPRTCLVATRESPLTQLFSRIFTNSKAQLDVAPETSCARHT